MEELTWPISCTSLGVGLLFRCHHHGVIVTVRTPRNKMKTYHKLSVKPIKMK